MSPQTPLKDVNDVLYAYQLPEPVPVQETPNEDNPVEKKEIPLEKGSPIYIRIVHRKVQKEQSYFISPYNVTLFSSPAVLSFKQGSLTNKQLYNKVAEMFKPMTERPEPEKKDQKERKAKKESKGKTEKKDGEERKPKKPGKKEKKENHETKDKKEKNEKIDDSTFPFELKIVSANGMSCYKSPWYLFSIGTDIPFNDETVIIQNDQTIALDWKVSVYMLNYHRYENTL